MATSMGGLLRVALLAALAASVAGEAAARAVPDEDDAPASARAAARGWGKRPTSKPFSWWFGGFGGTQDPATQDPAGQASFDDQPDPPAGGACNYFSDSRLCRKIDFLPETLARVGDAVAYNHLNPVNQLQSGELEPNQVDCGTPDYCGGTDDALTEITCSPFNVRRPSQGSADCCTGFCDQSAFDDSMIYSLGGDSGALAWGSPGATDDYWVFHGCDGAGLQTDCAGDGYYVEHFVELCPNGFGAGCECDIFSEDLHNQCPFTHPGTGATTRFMSCGWWNDAGQWSDSNFAWWPNNGAGLDPGGNSGQEWPDFAFSLYPWVCHKDESRDFSYFGTPSHVNCFCDNEPLRDSPYDPSCTSNPDYCQPPPVWYAYKAWWAGPFELKVFGGQVGAAVWDTFTLVPLDRPPW